MPLTSLMSMISTLSVPVPALALVPAIVVEAIVLAIMLNPGPVRALTTSLRASVCSALIVLTLLFAADILLVSLDERMLMAVLAPINAWAVSVAVIALPPGFLIAWWVKHSIVRRVVPYVRRRRVVQATGLAHFLSSCAMAAAAWALLSQWPAHGSYEIRMRISDSLSRGVSTRNAVSEFWAETGRLPDSAADLPEGILTVAHDVVTLEPPGRVTLRVSAPDIRELDGKRIMFTPIVPAMMQEPIRWQCSAPEIERKYLPAECRD
jgi:Pilin (bacterial filament)